ncbi:MAG: NAD(P)/FAD-dependent oxidoreductase [Gemmatimonadetes bacterium]|nr:NAD(P)/FAD-dependent oxidoreductase [Gemmatimonadota bacterium]
MADDVRDITIIGGGPTGLFAAFYAGLRGRSTRIIDALPELGGQLAALYPEKDVFDVGGFPRVLAKDLVRSLVEQGMQFGPDVVLDERVRAIIHEDGGFRLLGDRDTYRSRAVILAGGKGSLEPMVLDATGYGTLLNKGVEHSVKDPAAWAGRRVVVVGGGDSALDWALILKDHAASTTLVHRRDGWRAHQATVARIEAAVAAGELQLRTFHEVREIHGEERVEAVTVFDNRSGEETRLACDAVFAFLGFKPDLGPIAHWGLAVEKHRVKVSALMETSVPGIFAAGDLVDYPGKLDLIAAGFAEAAIAANQAVHWMDPAARVSPGHSTASKAFKDR